MNSLTKKKLQRFRSIKLGYYSFIVLTVVFVLSLFAELLVNNKAVMVRYEGQYYFPTYTAVNSGRTFGLDYDYEVNYRDLQQQFREEGGSNYVIMPIVPWGAYETDSIPGQFPPYPPSPRHLLGTDGAGRDLLARVAYGFRVCVLFSLIVMFFNYLIGITIGCMMGYFGGLTDLIGQRVIEVLSQVPMLYVIMILSSVLYPSFGLFVFIVVLLGWLSKTWVTRAQTYREMGRDYILASRVLGAGSPRVIFSHILPNILSTLVTMVPFDLIAGISLLTSLDYLGFGLPAPTPSWGALLREGTENLEAIWIVSTVTIAMTVVLIMVSFIGEAIREAYDPRKYTYYR